MVARGAGFDPARARQIRGQHAADGAAAGFAPEDRPIIHRLESKLLPTGGD